MGSFPATDLSLPRWSSTACLFSKRLFINVLVILNLEERKTRAIEKSRSVAQFMRGRSGEADGRAAKPENADGETVSA